jgi:Uma2 family endonuclease
MAAHSQPRLTPEEYLELERASETKHEFYNGHMYPLGEHAMAGGTDNHVSIIVNLTGELYAALKQGPCRVKTNDMRVRVSAAGLYTYPDLAVVCGEPKYADQRRDTLLNPILIIEVLSPSTESRDRGLKAQQYRQMGSLREYALVSQAEPRIELFRRQEGGSWLLSETVGMGAVCRFESIHCDIALGEVYDNVSFDPEYPFVTAPETSQGA